MSRFVKGNKGVSLMYPGDIVRLELITGNQRGLNGKQGAVLTTRRGIQVRLEDKTVVEMSVDNLVLIRRPPAASTSRESH